MFTLTDYTILLRILENEILIADPVTAHNLAKELSVIYVKTTYTGFQPATIDRLRSMMVYIKKTIPDYSDVLCGVLESVIYKMENRA